MNAIPSPAAVSMWQPGTVTPASYIVLDLETCDASESAIQRSIAGWKPPANLKNAATIARRRQEAAQAIRAEAALLDASPVICCAAITPTERVIFDEMPTEQPLAIPGWHIFQCGAERGLLESMRLWLELRTDDATVLVGHNLRKWDAPKLPALLQPYLTTGERRRLADTRELCRHFSHEHADNLFMALADVAEVLEIPRHKALMSGADVPRLYEQRRFAEILAYCAGDSAITARAYELMSGIALDLA